MHESEMVTRQHLHVPSIGGAQRLPGWSSSSPGARPQGAGYSHTLHPDQGPQASPPVDASRRDSSGEVSRGKRSPLPPAERFAQLKVSSPSGRTEVGTSPVVYGERKKDNDPTRIIAGDARRMVCHAIGCRTPPPHSLDGTKPVVRCGNHRTSAMRRVQYGDKICGEDGCEHPSCASHMDRDGQITHFCKEPVMPTISTTKKPHCKYPGCSKAPTYGRVDEPWSVCNGHKKAGMHTSRKGVVIVATQDGDAYRFQASSDVSLSSSSPSSARDSMESRINERAANNVMVDKAPPSPSRPVTHQSDGEKSKVIPTPSTAAAMTTTAVIEKPETASSMAKEDTSSSEDIHSISMRHQPRQTPLPVAQAGRQNPTLLAERKGVVPCKSEPGANTIPEVATNIVSSRRPRTKSRRALEAAGLSGNEGAQLMSKEMKADMARKQRELKEQHKAAEAAGLRRGEVIELLVEPPANSGDGNVPLGHGDNTVAAGTTTGTWKKLTPDELLRERELGKRVRDSMKRQEAAEACGDNHAEEVTLENIACATGWQGHPVSRKKRARVSSSEECGVMVQDGSGYTKQSAGVKVQEQQLQRRCHEVKHGMMPAFYNSGSWYVAHQPSSSTVCQFDGCTLRATFGVNSIARYCKNHHIFGMKEIIKSSG